MNLVQARTESIEPGSEELNRLKEALHTCDAVVIGAGAGLSASAGYTYSGERFERYFADFERVYGFHDMYTGGFCAYRTPEERWAYWSRNIYINRYVAPPKPVYEQLLKRVRDRDYFVLTTNVDHCFQRAGFDRKRLFYTQGDYGLWQCSKPCHKQTYDNRATVEKMLLAQGFAIAKDGALLPPEQTPLLRAVPSELVPRCPICGRPMSMNLRADDTFVEDAGWHEAAEHSERFFRTHRGKVLYLELGVGYNTPGIIKYPFWRMALNHPDSIYACINFDEACCPEELTERSILIEGDIWTALEQL